MRLAAELKTMAQEMEQIMMIFLEQEEKGYMVPVVVLALEETQYSQETEVGPV
jgi:hypothetical protein